LAIFCVVAISFDAAAGAAVVRLQCKQVEWKLARKVVKLLREAEAVRQNRTQP
jgi:hypothetical protein